MKSKVKAFLFVTMMMTIFSIVCTVTHAATIKENSIYYETSLETGLSNVINDENEYISDDTVYINGYSFINANDEIMEATCNPKDSYIVIPDTPEGVKKVMVHINSNISRLGWTDIENVRISDVATTKEEKAKFDAKFITEKVKEDEEIPQDSIILFDVSGSMASYMKDVYNNLNEITKSQQIEAMYAFANNISEEIDPKTFNNEVWNNVVYNSGLGGGTNIIDSLETVANKYPTAHIYLLTDLDNNQGSFVINNDFTGKITILEFNLYRNGTNQSVENFYNELKIFYKNAEQIERINSN